MAVQRIAPTQSPQLDGEATEAAWRDAGAVTIRTVMGVSNPGDYVDIEVKAVAARPDAAVVGLHDGAADEVLEHAAVLVEGV